jgi:hypothetical protein
MYPGLRPRMKLEIFGGAEMFFRYPRFDADKASGLPSL